MTIEEMRAALQDRNLKQIHRVTGMSWGILRRFAKKPEYIPRADFIERLRQYLEIGK